MLTEALEDRDDEMKKLKAKLLEVEDALSHARRSAHMVGVDNREVGGVENVQCGISMGWFLCMCSKMKLLRSLRTKLKL